MRGAVVTKPRHRLVTFTLCVAVGVIVSVAFQVGDEYRAREKRLGLAEKIGSAFVYLGVTAVSYPLMVVSKANEPEPETHYPGKVRRSGPRLPSVPQWIVGALASVTAAGTPVLFLVSLFPTCRRWFFVACGSMALALGLSPLWVLGVVKTVVAPLR